MKELPLMSETPLLTTRYVYEDKKRMKNEAFIMPFVLQKLMCVPTAQPSQQQPP